MSHANPVGPNADRNLLFGILALQMDFINRDALIQAMHAWVLDKAKPLGQILQEHGALREDARGLLELLVNKHLELHGNDPVRSLATVPPAELVRAELQRIADPELHASLAHCNGTPFSAAAISFAADSSMGTSTSAGTRFRIVRPHAKGGLGEVFVAVDEELRREVALKEIQSHHANHAESRARFVREAEITGGLEHPGVVPVYGLGEYADGRPFYAMRFIRGVSLQAAIDRFHKADGPGREPGEQTLELRQLLGRFVAVCNTMAYVHSRGVIHRDLKPGNVMLGPYGETLVVDWGLAKMIGQPEASDGLAEPCLATLAGDDSDLTRAGQALGTPAFMSPEQAAGRLDRLGPASDVYSLGATLYCMLTGKAPFTGMDVGVVLANVQLGEYLPPRQKNPRVPAALEAICLKAMALKPEERYASAKALADDLEHWLGDEPVTAHAEPWRERLGRWVRQHKGLVGSAAATCVLAVTIAIAWGMVASANSREAQEQTLHLEADQLRGLAEERGKEADKQRGLVQRLLYFSRIKNAELAWHENQMVRMEDLLTVQQETQPIQENLRGFEWQYLWRLRHSWLVNCQGHSGWVHSATFSPDGRRLASASHDRTVKIWDGTTGKEATSLKGHTDVVLCVTFSPDGRRLASASNKEVMVWDSNTGKVAFILQGHTTVAFSPDGRRLASAGGKDVMVWDATTGQETLSLEGHTRRVYSMAFSADGRRLASASNDGTVKVWDATSGQEELTLKGHTDTVWSMAFSPDSRHLAKAGGIKNQLWEVKVWDATTGQETLSLKGHTFPVTSVAFSPDGRRLASASFDRTVKVWDATTGQEALSLKGHTDWITDVAFSPDGRRLVSAGGDGVKVWEAIPPTPEIILKREAVYLVDSMCQKLIRQSDVLQQLREDPLLSEPLRKEALAQAEYYFHNPERLKGLAITFSQTGQYDQAITALTEALNINPKDAETYSQRGVAHADKGDFDKAAADYSKCTKLDPTKAEAWEFLACLRLQLGDTAGYRSACSRMLEQFGNSHDPDTANQVAWTCGALAPEAVADRSKPVELAQLAVTRQPKNYNYLNTLAAALYRSGKYEEAVQRIDEAIKGRGNEGDNEDWLFLAMAHHRLNHAEEANRWLAKAVKRIDQTAKEEPKKGTNTAVSWSERLEVQFLRREAEALLKGAKP